LDCPCREPLTPRVGDYPVTKADHEWLGTNADVRLSEGRVGPRVGYDHRYADAGVEAAPYPRRVIPVTTHARPRALQYKATMTRTKARCSAALWVFARSATARPSCTE